MLVGLWTWAWFREFYCWRPIHPGDAWFFVLCRLPAGFALIAAAFGAACLASALGLFLRADRVTEGEATTRRSVVSAVRGNLRDSRNRYRKLKGRERLIFNGSAALLLVAVATALVFVFAGPYQR